jgi:hypothetical protein
MTPTPKLHTLLDGGKLHGLNYVERQMVADCLAMEASIELQHNYRKMVTFLPEEKALDPAQVQGLIAAIALDGGYTPPSSNPLLQYQEPITPPTRKSKPLRTPTAPAMSGEHPNPLLGLSQEEGEQMISRAIAAAKSGELKSMIDNDNRLETLEAIGADLESGRQPSPQLVASAKAPVAPAPDSLRSEWDRDAALRAEFGDNFGAFAAFKKAEAQGRTERRPR